LIWSLADPVRTHQINAEGTLLTALAAVEASVKRFVYVSSSEAYGSALSLPMGEEHPLCPTTVYGASKAAGELYAQACMRTYGLPVTVVRPFNAYGPREHSSGTSAEVIPKFVSRLTNGMPPVIFGDGSQTRDFTWVQETSAGIVAAAGADGLVGEAINIASGKSTSILELAGTLLELFGRSPDEAVFDAVRPGDVSHHQADVRKAREACGFEARVSLREGLRRYIQWVRAAEHPDTVGEAEVVRNW
jgi:UDP-glucose 4-epimerase